MSRLWRNAGRAMLIASVTGVVLVASAIAYLRSASGLDFVRRQVEQIASGALTGDLTIGAITGDPLDTLQIRQVVLTDGDGRAAVKLESLQVEWSAWALLGGTIEVREVRLVRPNILAVRGPTGELNLQRLVPPSDTEPKPDRPLTPVALPSLKLDRLAIVDGAFRLEDGERVSRVDGVNLTASAEADGDRGTAVIDSLALRLLEEHDLHLTAIIGLRDGTRAEVEAVELKLDAASLVVPEAAYDLESTAAEAELALSVPAKLLAAVLGDGAVAGGAELHLTAAHEAGKPYHVRLSGRLAEAPMAVNATVADDLQGVAARVSLRRFDPQRAYRSAPRGQLNLRATVAADLRGVQPAATAELDLTGTAVVGTKAPAVNIQKMQVRASLDGSRVKAAVAARADRAELSFTARAALDKGPRIERGRLDLRWSDIARSLGPKLPARGDLTVTATVSGPIDALDVAARVRGRGLGYDRTAKVEALSLDAQVRGLPRAPQGTVSLSVGGIEVEGRPIDSVRAALVARSRSGRSEVDVRTLTVRTSSLEWKGQGARIAWTKAGRVSVRDFGLRSAAGRLSVTATVAAGGAGRKQPHQAVDVQLENLDLARLPRALVPELRGAAGRFQLSAVIARDGPQAAARVRARMRGFRPPDVAGPSPKVDGSVAIDLDDDGISAAIDASDPVMGGVSVRAEAPVPEDIASPDGWARQLRQRPVTRLRLSINDLKLARLFELGSAEGDEARAAKAGAPVAATISGQLDIGDGARTVNAKLDARELRPTQTDVPFPDARAQLVLSGADGRYRAQVDIEGEGLGRGTVSATVAGPKRLHDAGAWAKLGPDAVVGAAAELERLALSEWLRIVGVADITGSLSARIDAGPASRPLTADVALRGFRYGPVPGEFSADVQARLTGDGARIQAEVDRNQRPMLSLNGESPASIEALLTGNLGRFERAAVAGRLSLESLPLALLARIAGIPPRDVRGALHGRGTMSGTADRPQGRLRFEVRDMRLGSQGFPEFWAEARVGTATVSAAARMRDDRGKGVDLQASVDRQTRDDVSARVTADGMRLGFLSELGLLPVGLDANLHADVVATQSPSVAPDGWMELRDLRVVFAQAALQPITDGKARVDLSPSAADVSLTARSGELGRLSATMRAAIGNVQNIPVGGMLKLERFPVVAGALTRVDLDVGVEGRVQPELTRLALKLDNGFVTLPDENVENRHPIETFDDVVFVDESPRRRPNVRPRSTQGRTALEINTVQPVTVRGGPVEAKLAVGLNVEAKQGKTAVVGAVETTDGFVVLFGRRYDILQARVTLEGRDPPDPRVRIELRHDFPTLSLTVDITGSANAPDLKFRGAPARYSEAELLTVFLGTDPEDLGKDDERSLGDQAAGAVAGFLMDQLESQVGKSLPLDTLDVELGDTASGTKTRVTLGKWITRQVFLAYRYRFDANLAVENDSEAVVQYRFLPGWMVEVVLGLTQQGADLLWLKRF